MAEIIGVSGAVTRQPERADARSRRIGRFGALGKLANILAFDRTPASERLSPRPHLPLLERPRAGRQASAEQVAKLWDYLERHSTVDKTDRARLADLDTLLSIEHYASNIESLIGTVKVPVGLAGPLRVNGLYAQGDYLVPLATTEAAMVAGYDRGAHAISLAGGAAVALTAESMIRSPGFAFSSLYEAGAFATWCSDAFPELQAAAEATTRHGKLIEVAAQLEGDVVYLICRYTTGDASGQNMVTIATEALCAYAVEHAPVRPRYWFVEANLSGDKKASALAAMGGRGRSATATVTLPAKVVEKVLRTTPERMHDLWRMSALGGVMSGTIGVQAHYANGLAALYLATGQDVACVSESAIGVTRVELRGGDLFVSVNLPSLVLGTVGGGTSLPTQSVGLRILGLAGTGHAAALAEVAACLCLAGEVSIGAALSSGQFTRAHQTLARDRR
jgi:hydroxymethylglutaryl-CoA reductase (NADPH)